MPKRPHNDPPTDSLTGLREAERDAAQSPGGHASERGFRRLRSDGRQQRNADVGQFRFAQRYC